MFVITADQIDSTNDIDRTGAAVTALNEAFSRWLLLPADQNAGDEIQALVSDPAAAFAMIMRLIRTGHWSVGVGIGTARLPLPDATRKSVGSAFTAARLAVTRAKGSPTRFALETSAATTVGPEELVAADVEALLIMLLITLDRRSEEGWEVVDLLRSGLNQQQIAKRIGISSQAVSMRVKAAHWRTEAAVTPALIKLMNKLDNESAGTEPAP